MQKVDASKLQKVYSETPTISFTPVGDNITAFSNTTDRLARGLVTRVVSNNDASLPAVKVLLTCDSRGSLVTMPTKVLASVHTILTA